MRLVHDIAHARSAGLPAATAVTIGNFDGCHRGHQRLVAHVREEATALGAAAIALTFTPRPEAFFKKLERDRLLFTPSQKERAFAELGVDALVVQRFDEAFSKTEALDFVERCLMRELGARAVVVGPNFFFGRGRQGNPPWLAERGSERGLRVTILEPSLDAEGIVSSSRVREALESGDVAAARDMLGRPYLIEGRVERGDQIGRTLDCPTANLGGIQQIVPGTGVFLVHAVIGDAAAVTKVDDRVVPGVCNIGYRPTLGLKDPQLRVETHLLAGAYGSDELYGKPLALYFSEKLRDDLKLGSMDELKAVIASDVAQARQLHRL